MLTPKEQGELERCLAIHARRIISDDEAAAQLARIARRGKLDALLASIPAELAGPLRKCVEDAPPPQRYSPATLPAVTSVDIVAIDSRVNVSRIEDSIRVAAGRSVTLSGDNAESIAALWRRLPPDEQARCHIPSYGVRFHSDSGPICEASICWECNNIFGWMGDEELCYRFDAEAPVALQLLAELREALGDPHDP